MAKLVVLSILSTGKSDL